MILVFGGTTEGRKAVAVLEEAGTAYFYSTKTGEQDITLHHGVRTDGAMDAEAMRRFCEERGVRLIVDAAHPFAERLHATIVDVAASLQLPVVRFERIYPERAPDITWIDDFAQVPTDITTLLATTGVQSIGRLKWLEEKGVRVVYRILNRPSSIALAHQQGASDDQLVFYDLTDDALPLPSHVGDGPSEALVSFDAILLKESGLSGGFVEKVAEARAKGMRVIAVKRPEMPIPPLRQSARSENEKLEPLPLCSVDGPHGLRRAVERLLPEFFPLKSGLTTGTCATAAAVAATRRMTTGEQPAEVPVVLPDGETIMVDVGYGDGYAYCFKDAGDDPDVTNGIEIRATVAPAEQFQILGGAGVGRFTLPGFDYPPGEAAINKGPRAMLRQNIKGNFRITISVPAGADIARRTFNPRLGIEGGISIIGVSGIVKPFSEEAFVDSIRRCVAVALASGSPRVVINSGGKSERFLRARYPELPAQAFVQYGNYIGETLRIARELGIRRVTLGVMLGKAVKLAAGNLDTHSRRATMDKDFIREMLREAGCEIDISAMTLARELWEMLDDGARTAFARVVVSHCRDHCAPLLPDGELEILLIDDNGKIYETLH